MTYTNKQKVQRKFQLALRRLFSTNTPSKEIVNLLGIDKNSFIEYINKYMLSGMTIDNFGSVWGLDHIVPSDLFDFYNENDLKLCYNYNNIMPMFNNDNRLKGASIHFSLIKLNSMNTNNSIEQLKEICDSEIQRYNKYLI